MTDLYPTPTRLALLRDVDAGDVWHVEQRTATYDMNGATCRRCTLSMRELKAAGWVELGPPPSPMSHTPHWRLTDAGRAVLERGKP